MTSQAAEDAGDAGGGDDRPPVEAGQLAEGSEQVGQGRSHGEGPDEDADCQAALAPEPARDDLHPDRVDAGQGEPREEAEQDRTGFIACDVGEAEVGGRGAESSDEEEDAARQDVNGASDGEQECTGDEAELNGDRHEREIHPPEMPVDHEQRRDGGRAEPGRHREQFAETEEDEETPAGQRLGIAGLPSRRDRAEHRVPRILPSQAFDPPYPNHRRPWVASSSGTSGGTSARTAGSAAQEARADSSGWRRMTRASFSSSDAGPGSLA